MECFGATDTGRVRSSNQDTFRLGELSDTALYAVVCDGMGGTSGGAIASAITADILEKRITSQYRENMPTASVFNLLESAIDAANIEVLDRACEDVELMGMGTTVVAVMVQGDEAIIAHVGDSRLYHLSKDGLCQVTTDHSVVQEMIEKGQLTAEQAKGHPRKHFITRAVGVANDVRADYDTITLEKGDRLLLCSDGLTNMLSEAEIAEILSGDSALAAQLLIQAANLAGGEDNITAVVIAERCDLL